MIKIEFSEEKINELRRERFYQPHPLVQKRCETVLLKACEISTSKIAEIVGITTNSVRNHCKAYQAGGIEALKVISYKGQKSKLGEHKTSIEEEFQKDPPATVSEAADRIENLTGIKRGLTQTQAFMKKIGMKYRKTASIPAKADKEKQEQFKKKSLCQGLQKPEMRSGWFFL